MENPESAAIDLATEEGVKMVKGQWRYSDTKIIEVDFQAPGPDKQPTGAPIKTYDYTPHAGGADFDDSKWEVISATTLDQRRSSGRLCFNWYRIKLTIPERVGDFDRRARPSSLRRRSTITQRSGLTASSSRYLGQMGGTVVGGWNAPNRVVIGRDVKPGQQIQLAVFGINGPHLESADQLHLDALRAARVLQRRDAGPVAITPSEVNVEVVRKDPAIDRIVGPNPKIFKLAEGFKFTEGPVWVRRRTAVQRSEQQHHLQVHAERK